LRNIQQRSTVEQNTRAENIAKIVNGQIISLKVIQYLISPRNASKMVLQ